MPKILLVDDNEMNRDMLSRRLVRKDYEVICAVDCAETVAIAAGDSPGLNLMDRILPVLDGGETKRRLKDDDANPIALLLRLGNIEAPVQSNL